MPLFSYEAITTNGQSVSGSRVANTSGEVEEWLVSKGQHPVKITIGGKADDDSYDQDDTPGFLDRLQGIRLEDKILFCRQVSTMLDAGVPILQALRIMRNQTSNKNIRVILVDVADRVEEGASLSEAFSHYPRFGGTLFYNIVKVGEETGTLDSSFEYLALLYENEKEVSERVKAATRYPKIVITAMFAAVFFLMSFVVPKFVELFRNARVELPLPTKILIIMSDFVVNYFWLIIFGVAALFITYQLLMRYDSYRLIRDKIWLKVPIFGVLSLKIFLSRFCRVFAVLLKSGVDVIRTLELSSSSLENLVLFNDLDRVTAEVRQGSEMHDALAKHNVFPEMVVQMMAIGEQSGQVDSMMDKVADYYERETNYTIKNLSTMLEPILLFFMGIMVGFLALAIYMPMWSMMDVLKGG